MLLLFLVLQDEKHASSKWLWVAYTFVVALDTHFFIYSLLVSGSQGIWLLLKNRVIFKRWLLSQGIALIVSAYLVTWVIMEQGQVGWLPKIGQTTIEEIFVGQAFWGNPTLAFVANGLVLAVLAGAYHPAAQLPRVSASQVQLLAISILLPPALILGYSLLGHPIYDSRYFTMTAPMVALVLAIGVDQLFSARLAPVALLLVVVLAVPSYARFRAVDSKNTHWSLVAAELHNIQRPGDGVLFADYDRKSPSQSRIMIGYRSLVSDLQDLTVVSPYQRAKGLYPKRVPAQQVTDRIAASARVIIVAEKTEKAEFQTLKSLVEGLKFRLLKRVGVSGTSVVVFEKAK